MSSGMAEPLPPSTSAQVPLPFFGCLDEASNCEYYSLLRTQEGTDSVAWDNNKSDQVAQEMAMQEPILVAVLQETATGNWDWTKG